MKDMMICEKQKKEGSVKSVLDDQPCYPYGLKITLEPESYNKLELKEPPQIGDKFLMLANVEVCSLYKDKSYGDVPKISMGLQITGMDLKNREEDTEKEEAESKSMSEKIYG